MKKLRFIDLFAGIGGMRIGIENACKKKGIVCECVFSSEIKEHAKKVYEDNFGNHIIHGDITKIHTKDIPDFDILLAGFPCQAFSSAGKRRGFLDTRGTLFFEIERILKDKKPYGFILENVEGLVNHDSGKTFETITGKLKKMKYILSHKVLNSKDFGLPQDRKRIFIVGTKDRKINLDAFDKRHKTLSEILENGLETMDTEFTRKLLKHYKPSELYGKSVKDKRGGENNIHSWDIGLKGEVSDEQKELLNALLKERRKKQWAREKGMTWMDGMPLTKNEISAFFKSNDLGKMLEDLEEKGYVRYEYPKGKLSKTINGWMSLERGYNIVTGKLSFEISKVLDPNGISPTLVATDMCRIGIVDGEGIRKLSINEGLRLFGFPENFKMDVDKTKAYDLLGNSVGVPIVEEISKLLVGNII